MELSKILRDYRQEHGLTLQVFADRAGLTKQYISMLENNKNSKNGKPIIPSLETLRKLSSAMFMNIDTLVATLDGEQDVSLQTKDYSYYTPHKGVRIPILGYVIAGVPIEAVEDILGYEEISTELARTGDFFCLRIKGDSMEPTFSEGDIIVVRQQPDVESNEIAVVLVNGDEGTVKRIKKSDAGITLIGDNVSSFLPTFYSNEDIERLPVTIIGKVIELRRSF